MYQAHVYSRNAVNKIIKVIVHIRSCDVTLAYQLFPVRVPRVQHLVQPQPPVSDGFVSENICAFATRIRYLIYYNKLYLEHKVNRATTVMIGRTIGFLLRCGNLVYQLPAANVRVMDTRVMQRICLVWQHRFALSRFRATYVSCAQYPLVVESNPSR